MQVGTLGTKPLASCELSFSYAMFQSKNAANCRLGNRGHPCFPCPDFLFYLHSFLIILLAQLHSALLVDDWSDVSRHNITTRLHRRHFISISPLRSRASRFPHGQRRSSIDEHETERWLSSSTNVVLLLLTARTQADQLEMMPFQFETVTRGYRFLEHVNGWIVKLNLTSAP